MLEKKEYILSSLKKIKETLERIIKNSERIDTYNLLQHSIRYGTP